jgi:hypothetical protein
VAVLASCGVFLLVPAAIGLVAVVVAQRGGAPRRATLGRGKVLLELPGPTAAHVAGPTVEQVAGPDALRIAKANLRTAASSGPPARSVP